MWICFGFNNPEVTVNVANQIHQGTAPQDQTPHLTMKSTDTSASFQTEISCETSETKNDKRNFSSNINVRWIVFAFICLLLLIIQTIWANLWDGAISGLLRGGIIVWSFIRLWFWAKAGSK